MPGAHLGVPPSASLSARVGARSSADPAVPRSGSSAAQAGAARQPRAARRQALVRPDPLRCTRGAPGATGHDPARSARSVTRATSRAGSRNRSVVQTRTCIQPSRPSCSPRSRSRSRLLRIAAYAGPSVSTATSDVAVVVGVLDGEVDGLPGRAVGLVHHQPGVAQPAGELGRRTDSASGACRPGGGRRRLPPGASRPRTEVRLGDGPGSCRPRHTRGSHGASPRRAP